MHHSVIHLFLVWAGIVGTVFVAGVVLVSFLPLGKAKPGDDGF